MSLQPPMPLQVFPRSEIAVAQRTLRMKDLLVCVCVDSDSNEASGPSPPANQWMEVIDLERMALRMLPIPTAASGSATQQGGASYRSTFFSRVIGLTPLADVRDQYFQINSTLQF